MKGYQKVLNLFKENSMNIELNFVNLVNFVFLLVGKKGFIIGIVNDKLIVFVVVKVVCVLGVDVVLIYQNDKIVKYIQLLVELIGVCFFEKFDVMQLGSLEVVIEKCGVEFGWIDFVIYLMVFCEVDDLYGCVIDIFEVGFDLVMNIFCYSFLCMVKVLELLMIEGGLLIIMFYFGVE